MITACALGRCVVADAVEVVGRLVAVAADACLDGIAITISTNVNDKYTMIMIRTILVTTNRRREGFVTENFVLGRIQQRSRTDGSSVKAFRSALTRVVVIVSNRQSFDEFRV